MVYAIIDNKPVLTSDLKITNLAINNDTIGNLYVISTSTLNSVIQDVNVRVEGGLLNNLNIKGIQLDDTRIKIDNQIFQVILITGEIVCDEKIIAQCEMKIFIS